ncbi:MAG: hypothetical protein QM783_09270 [Phycisphaerales bacterium]
MDGELFLVVVAFSCPLLLSCGVVLALLGLRVRGPGPVCVCGYSRAGLRSDVVCPECGSLKVSTATQSYVLWQLIAGVALAVIGALCCPLSMVLLMAR